jgi:hypothetical protein
MMRNIHRCALALAASAIWATAALATQPKIDAETCAQLRLEQNKFRQSGILNDMRKGPEWAKANLTPERLREVEHYLTLDEQVEFGCRDAKLSPDAEKASEAASRIEKNSDADPTAPLTSASPKAGGASPVADPPKPSKPASVDNWGAKRPASHKKRAIHKKAKSVAPQTKNIDKVTQPTQPRITESAVSTRSAQPSASEPVGAPDSGQWTPVTPAFGFGETGGVTSPSP